MPLNPGAARVGTRFFRRMAAFLVAAGTAASAAQAALPGPDVLYGVGIDGFGDQSAQSFGSLTMSNARRPPRSAPARSPSSA
jgi:hypothetical protein